MESFLTPLFGLMLARLVVLVPPGTEPGHHAGAHRHRRDDVLRRRAALRRLVVLAGLGIAAAVAAWQYVLQDYMRNRVMMFLNPTAASAADRYNVEQAMISIGSGGWFGQFGLFRGSQASSTSCASATPTSSSR